MTSALDYTDDRHLIVADGGLPPGSRASSTSRAAINVIRGWRRWLVRLRYLLVHLGLSDQSLRPRDARRCTPRPSNPDSLIFLMIGRDAADGRMRLTPLLRRFDIRWNKAGSAALFADLRRTAQRARRGCAGDTVLRAGRRAAEQVHDGPPARRLPDGRRPGDGVVDDVGRVHGYPGLHVLDGSIVPTALGVNPSKTIAALAERGIARLVADAGLSRWHNHTGNQRCRSARASRTPRTLGGARRSSSPRPSSAARPCAPSAPGTRGRTSR